MFSFPVARVPAAAARTLAVHPRGAPDPPCGPLSSLIIAYRHVLGAGDTEPGTTKEALHRYCFRVPSFYSENLKPQHSGYEVIKILIFR